MSRRPRTLPPPVTSDHGFAGDVPDYSRTRADARRLKQVEPLRAYYPRFKRVATAANMAMDDTRNIRHFLNSLSMSPSSFIEILQLK